MGSSHHKGFWKKNETLWIGLGIATLLHLVIVFPAGYWMINYQTEDEKIFHVDFFGLDELTELKEKTPEELLEEYDPEEDLPDGQVVRAPPSKDKRKPEDARFLSEEDARVEKETKSRIQLPGDSHFSSPNQSQSKGRDSKSEEGGMKSEKHTVTPEPDNSQAEEGGQIPAKNQALPTPENTNLQLSRQAMAVAIKGSGLDHLEDVIPGDMTALNTRSWQFAQFFNRVKKQVEYHWHPDVEYRKHDPYGNVYGFKDRTTVILVVLRSDGSLKHAYVMGPSGATFLDKEAKEAIEQAAPFPNVPAGLKDKDDELVKFTFHFLVKVGGQPIFRMRRYE